MTNDVGRSVENYDLNVTKHLPSVVKNNDDDGDNFDDNDDDNDDALARLTMTLCLPCLSNILWHNLSAYLGLHPPLHGETLKSCLPARPAAPTWG